MKTKIFTIFDNKVEAYLPPFFMPTSGAAIRAIQDSKGENLINHPEDFSLWELGEYDDADAIFKNLEPKKCLGTIIELMPSKAE